MVGRSVGVVAALWWLAAPVLADDAPAGTGSILVAPDVSGATVVVDGEERGVTPTVIDGVPVGSRLVEILADGYEAYRETVQVEANGRVTVNPVLRRGVSSRSLRIVTRPVATVLFDGKRVGLSPLRLPSVDLGEHTVEASADGYEVLRRTLNVGLLTPETLTFDLSPVQGGGSSGVTSSDDNLSVDPAERPREAQLPSGAGFDELAHEDGSADPAPAPVSGLITRQARTLDPLVAALDLSLGWPHLLEAGLSVGMIKGFDVGVRVRTFGRLTEFEGRGKLSTSPMSQLSLAGQVRLGGGLGPTRDGQDGRSHSINTFFLSLEGLLTLHFAEAASFTLWLATDAATDKYDFSGTDADQVVVTDVPGFDTVRDGRQNTLRLRFGGALGLVLSNRWSAFGELEGILLGPERDILGDVYRFGANDTELYARVGVTYAF